MRNLTPCSRPRPGRRPDKMDLGGLGQRFALASCSHQGWLPGEHAFLKEDCLRDVSHFEGQVKPRRMRVLQNDLWVYGKRECLMGVPLLETNRPELSLELEVA